MAKRKVVAKADQQGGAWWERATGGNFLRLKGQSGKKFVLKLTFAPRERMMKFGKQKPRPVLDISTDKGTLTVGLQSSIAALLASYVAEHGGNPASLRGRVLSFAVKGEGTSREYPGLALK